MSPRARTAAKPLPRLTLLDPSATPEEAAAIVAALERFMRATVPAGGGPGALPGADAWRLAGLLEGVQQGVGGDLRHPWINT